MSNRRKSKLERAKVTRKRCLNCKSFDLQRKDYDDAVLYICKDCRFPERVAKS